MVDGFVDLFTAMFIKKNLTLVSKRSLAQPHREGPNCPWEMSQVLVDGARFSPAVVILLTGKYHEKMILNNYGIESSDQHNWKERYCSVRFSDLLLGVSGCVYLGAVEMSCS